MLALNLSLLLDSILIFALAFLIDLVFGEYPNRIHPTIGIGKMISYLKRRAKSSNPRIEKANGVLMALAIMMVVALPVLALLFWLRTLPYGEIFYIIVGAILFKATFAIRGMGQYTLPIAKTLKQKRFSWRTKMVALYC